MLTYPLSILEINHDSFKGDAILYIYIENELKDAVTLTTESKKPPTVFLEFSSDSSIQITSKDLNNGVYLGSLSFRASLLLENSESIILPLNSSTQITSLEPAVLPWIKLSMAANEKSLKSPKNRENIRENDIFRAIQSELDLEKWKNTGLKQIREEMNSSELARVSVMQQLCKTVEKYEREISELRNSIGQKTLIARNSHETLKTMEEVLKASQTSWLAKQVFYEDRMKSLKCENLTRRQEILEIREKNLKMKENLKKIQENQETSENNRELIEKKELLEFTLKNLKLELELNKSNLHEAVDQIINFQNNNTKLRAYIENLEEKTEKLVKEQNFDILSLVNTHLDALSIQADVSQVTKNIFKIDNDSLYLFLSNGELMTKVGTETVTFVEWLQKNKWLCEEEQATFEKPKRLDTVPEEEGEDEVLASPVFEKKRNVKKSPGKVVKEYSPILRKKSVK
jgi:hypothetical protein